MGSSGSDAKLVKLKGGRLVDQDHTTERWSENSKYRAAGREGSWWDPGKDGELCDWRKI